MKIIAIIIVCIAIIFWLLQKVSDRKYRPTKSEMIEGLNKIIDGSIDYSHLDELCSVKIAYDTELESIRQRLNDILDDPKSTNHPHSEKKGVDLSEEGKSLVQNLIDEIKKET
jgi:hypothetical protein